MDHYKVLGLSKNATKDQIKQAFRELALQFHPDKHSLSPKSVQEDATRRFKLASEAYDVLIDDRKRANYNNTNYQSNGYGGRSNSTNNTGFSSSYGYGYSRSKENYGGQYYNRRGSNVSKFEVFLHYMKTRSFLINLAFAGLNSTNSTSHGNNGYGGKSNSTNNTGFSSSYGYDYSRSRENYGGQYYNRGSNVSIFEAFLWYMKTCSFLINLAFAGVLLGGSYFIDSSGKALWKMRNNGKSFEEVMETMEKTKVVREKKT